MSGTAGDLAGDHAGNHVHLTNCIHLRRHHHKQRNSPTDDTNLAESALLRDLAALQRSRSLRDPSASPPSTWLSPSGASKRRPGRRSVDAPRLSASSRSPHPADSADVSTLPRGGGLKTLLEELSEASIGAKFRSNTAIRGKRRKFRVMAATSRRDHKVNDFRGASTVEAMQPVASLYSSSQDAICRRCHGDEKDELEMSYDSRNVCGIPWNLSRIHHRGKSFLDLAGRSLSCGLSDSMVRKLEQKGTSKIPAAANSLTPSSSSASEASPLLVEASGMQSRSADAYLGRDYSGELGIFSSQSLGEEDSDLASEARSGQRSKGPKGRHRSLVQKYVPRTFKDIVGQNLIVQALSNAVARRKVGLVYVFYGPNGTGKTSCARVFAKALTCQSAEHPKPCDTCSSCVAHNLGKSRNILEVGPVSHVDLESIVDVLDDAMLPGLSSHFRVFILDDCDTLPADLWSVISKVIDRAPRHVVFILVSPNLDLPHIIISRCQKFFFPKLKESDVIDTLRWISTSEGLEVDRDALKLIASLSDGSLRDAEMTLDQLSLLGQRITMSLVQELVGLVSEEKLVDLLDLALSADTVNTVKRLRDITESGVEPLALMTQLATVITDILAGSYLFTRERTRRKFFQRPTLSKSDMEKLRQALRTLSEAEKQLRLSNDKITWLTSALLQLAPDKQYVLPSSSPETVPYQGPLSRDAFPNQGGQKTDHYINSQGLSREFMTKIRENAGGSSNLLDASHGAWRPGEHTPDSLMLSAGATNAAGHYSGKVMDNNLIWQNVLRHVESDTLRKFLMQDGRLGSVSLGTAPTVQLIFSPHVNKSKAEKFRGLILEAFESVLLSPVILEIRYDLSNTRTDDQVPVFIPSHDDDSSNLTLRKSFARRSSHSTGVENYTGNHSYRKSAKGAGSSHSRWLQSDPHILKEGEIIELRSDTDRERRKGSVWEDTALPPDGKGKMVPLSRRNYVGEQHTHKSLVRGKITLAHVINRAESSRSGGWSRRKAISIAEKLEQENLRLEPRSRNLLCWKAPQRARTKLVSPRMRNRRLSRHLSKLVICGRCLREKSPR